jgi:hypothetical protein
MAYTYRLIAFQPVNVTALIHPAVQKGPESCNPERKTFDLEPGETRDDVFRVESVRVKSAEQALPLWPENGVTPWGVDGLIKRKWFSPQGGHELGEPGDDF